MCGCLWCAPIGDLAHNPGMCPEWELNQQPFLWFAGTQSTEPHQAGRQLDYYQPLTAKLYERRK